MLPPIFWTGAVGWSGTCEIVGSQDAVSRARVRMSCAVVDREIVSLFIEGL